MNSECIQATKNISVPNIKGDFHIYITRQNNTLTKIENDIFCGNMNMDISPYIMKLKFFFKNTCSTIIAWIHVGLLQSKSKRIYLPKKVCLIIIHRNTTYLLDMSCCYKHQQQRYYDGNTKIHMFMHHMYVDILFLLTSVIPIMSERVTIHYQTL